MITISIDLAVKIKNLKAEFNQILKIYNELGSSEEYFNWHIKESMKYLHNFNNGFEKFFKYNIFSSNKDDNPELRKAYWAFFRFTWSSELMPDSWDSVTSEHVPNFNKFKKVQDFNVRKMKRLFSSVMSLLSNSGYIVGEEQRTVINGMNVTIMPTNTDKHEKQLKLYLSQLKECSDMVIKSGFKKAILDLNIIFDFANEDIAQGGSYNRDNDEFTINVVGVYGNTSDYRCSTFVHEIGHRFWFKYVGNVAKAEWIDFFNKKGKVEQKDADDFKDFVHNEKQKFDMLTVTNDEFKKHLISRLPTVPEDKHAVFKYIIDNTRRFTLEDEVLNSKIDFRVGELFYKEFITDYATENPVEAFAEAFMLYVTKKGKLGPVTTYIFEEICRYAGVSISSTEKRS
jgi:hypothetical protein